MTTSHVRYVDSEWDLANPRIPWPGMSIEIQNDSLGPINKHVTLLNHGYPVKSVLYPVKEGSVVEFGNVPMDLGPSWREINGYPDPDKATSVLPFWYVDVDGKRIMQVCDYETWPPMPSTPKMPRRERLRRWYQGIPDRIAGHFGFVRDCGQDDY